MRWWALTLGVLLSSGVRAQSAEEPPANTMERPLTKAERRAAQAAPGGCAKVCSQHEACIAQRCVALCRPACRDGAYCTDEGECQPLQEPVAPLLTEMDQQRLRGAESSDMGVTLFTDLGGVFGAGVRPSLEWGDTGAFLLRLHLLNTGLMSHAAFAENEYQKFDWGFGTSFGYRKYEATHGNMRGFFFGGGLEVAAISVVGRAEAQVSQLLFSAAPYGEFGYRWVFGKMLVGFGPTLSLRYPLATGIFGRDEDLCLGDSECEDSNRRRFEGGMQFEFGWFQ